MRSIFRRVILLATLPIASCGYGAAAEAPQSGGVPLYEDLGTHHYAISTTVPLAQRYFDQGLRLYYAFNHAEAIRAFEEAARLDPACGICEWGVALSYGPNINLPMDSASGVAAYAALQRAIAKQDSGSDIERALIRALRVRYAAVPGPDRAALDSAYARAMADVVERHGADAEAGTLYAEALMTLSPWQYWNADGSPRPDTPELLAQLERVLAAQPDHPGANHFYIHAVEAVDPARAVPMAERLAGLMPGAGHIVHMPGHIYVRVGRYLDAIRANEHAIHADETFIRDHNPALGVYTIGYYPHNYDFLAFASSMIGRSRQAIDAADRMSTLVATELLGQPGLALLQNHVTRRLQMRVRFGRWAEILQAEAPAEDLLYARAIWHYARGRALAIGGDAAGAQAELRALRTIAADPSLEETTLEFNAAAALLRIAVEVLAGSVAGAAGDHGGAITHLKAARDLEDALVYGEPPEWSVPVRHDLGAALLEAGRAEEALATYREDLARFPANGWSLKGVALSLAALGRSAEAADAERRFDEAWRSADIVINGSRF